MQTYKIETPDGIYMIRKSFVDEINKMAKSRFSLLGRKFKMDDIMIVRLAIEEDAVMSRVDK
jgi:hypothetical protein